MDLLVDGVGTDQIKEEYIAGLPRSEASFFRPASLRIAERVVVKDHHVSEIEVDIVPVEPETGKQDPAVLPEIRQLPLPFLPEGEQILFHPVLAGGGRELCWKRAEEPGFIRWIHPVREIVLKMHR